MALDDLEKKLYKPEEFEKDQKQDFLINLQKEKEISEGSSDVSEEFPIKAVNNEKHDYQKISDWKEANEMNSKKGFLNNFLLKFNKFSVRIFWLLIIIMAILTVAVGFYVYQYFSVNREISLSLSAPENAMLGVPFDLTVNFNNNSRNVLNDVTVSVFLPEGAIVLGNDSNKRVITKKIGELEANAGFNEKISIIIFGAPSQAAQILKKFDASISYASALSARFEKSGYVEVSVYESAIKLDLISPEKVLNGEEFEFIANYSNVSQIDFSDVQLNLIYPVGFKLKKSSQEISNGILNINKLNKGQSGSVLISGSIIGPEQSFFDIKSQIEIIYSSQPHLINEKIASVNIASSPLSLKIILENINEQNFVSTGNFLKYRLFYQNNTDVGLQDAIIKAVLSGEMFDFTSLKTIGAFNSKNNTLTWDAGSIGELKILPANVSGGVEFEIKIKDNYPIKKMSDKNFILKISAEISSPTVPYYVAADKTIGLANLETKIAGRIDAESQVYFNDFGSGVANKGSLPPRVNYPVNFTVHLIIKNYATDIKDVVLKTYLAPGVKFIKIAKNNIFEAPVYNERTQEIVWSIPKIVATKGILGKPVEAVFQIEALPNITQISGAMPLLGEIIISAIDEFTGVELMSAGPALTSALLKDSGFDIKKGEVMP